jgi:HSP20 family protein
MTFRNNRPVVNLSTLCNTNNEVRSLLNLAVPTLDSLLDAVRNPFSPVKTDLLEKQYPRLNAYVKDGNMVVDLFVPYYTRDNISVESDPINAIVMVAGTATQDTGVGDNDYHIRQISRGSFRRELQFTKDYDIDKMSAELQDGILRLIVPPVKAAEPVKTKKVTIL